MNRIAFDEDSEADRRDAAEAAVAGLESLMDDSSGEFSMTFVRYHCPVLFCSHVNSSDIPACNPFSQQQPTRQPPNDQEKKSATVPMERGRRS
jgi:hypothetical protein